MTTWPGFLERLSEGLGSWKQDRSVDLALEAADFCRLGPRKQDGSEGLGPWTHDLPVGLDPWKHGSEGLGPWTQDLSVGLDP